MEVILSITEEKDDAIDGMEEYQDIRKLSKRILSMMPYYSAIRTRRMLYKESLT